jgi:hypothetical protein
MIPSVIKCKKCKWTKIADYGGFQSKSDAIMWADQLHQKENPDCSYRFKELKFTIIPKGEDPNQFAKKIADNMR